MAQNPRQIGELARSYTGARCSQDPPRVVAHHAAGGTIATGMAEVAEALVASFPDIEVLMDDLIARNAVVEYRWTFTGTSTETGKRVRIAGFEEWTIGADGLIASSRGNYDEAEYDRGLEHGFSG